VTSGPSQAPVLRWDGARDASDDELLTTFLAYVAATGLSLYPAQEEAILELASGSNVILATPTGSGKSLVALALHFFSMARGGRSVYTCPIKALASEKFFQLSRELGPENVGLMTGDGSVNRGAPVICCTAEVLANMALREGEDAPVDHVVVDEFHYYADRERGTAWQVPLLTLRRARFLLMSATFGDTKPFEAALTRLNGRPTAVVESTHRPVPLDFTYRETPLHETVADLLKQARAPVYLVNFTQRSAAEEAQNLMSVDIASKDEKKLITEALRGVRFDTPYGKELSRFVRHGVGLHHAGLLPKYRLAVEKLAQKGLLKVISGTDTLGVGVNVPIRTVLFTKLCKFDGEKTAILKVRDFLQISGRAGRKGFDDRGSVVAQAPEHVVENLRLEAKAGSDPVKKRRIVRKKPPDKGYVHWDRATFERLCTAPPEPLTSRFQVSQGMLLNVLSREGGGCLAMGRLIKSSHERPVDKKRLGRTAMSMFKSLALANVVEVAVVDGHKRVVLHEDLQTDFSLHQALSLYLVETLPLIAAESETYALDLLTLVEAILENPDLVLMKQVDLLKTRKMAELKAAGVEYDERIAELDKVEHPKPNEAFLYDTFNAFAQKHGWVLGVLGVPGAAGAPGALAAPSHNVRPKSVARDMYEKFLSFGEYIREYGLERGEGVLLRYLSDVYKVLVQTVPVAFKTPEVEELTVYFGAMVRQVDSSLLDEWERLRAGEPVGEPGAGAADLPVEPEGSKDVTRDERAFTVLVRNELWALVRAIAKRDWDGAATLCAVGGEWTRGSLEAALAPFFEEHAELRTDTSARSPSHLTLTKGEWQWEFTQVLVDGDDACDWVIAGAIDLEASRLEARPVMRVKRIGT